MVQIVPMREEDRGLVRTLELFCLRETIEPVLTKKWSDLRQDLVDQLGASSAQNYDHYVGSRLSYVAKEKRTIVGFVFAKIVTHVYSVPKMVWVENVGVHPDHRRKGVAYRLLKAVALEGKRQGAKAMHSAIMPDNIESIMLHKKLGFFVDGRKIAFLDLEGFK
ncbi:MAG: GNAT family N-acetyltransferase [Euryarchaeota archaeon]|nr:GNAT family N-acetyltransferase [Euryarchaeota archaeon]